MARGAARAAALVGLALVAVGCRQDMHDAPRIDPLEGHDFFLDGQGARPIPAGTIGRGRLREDSRMFEGKDADGAFLDTLPMPLTYEILARGRQRFDIYCSVCHDSSGSGRGMIVRRGFKQPESYHSERLRGMPVGYFFDVMTNGYGVMSSYASQVPVADRWAIAAYIRALQLSQGVALDGLPAEVAQAFRDGMAHPADDGHGGAAGGHHTDGGHGDDHGDSKPDASYEPGSGIPLPAYEASKAQ